MARKCGKKLKDVLYFSNKLLRVRPHDSVYCAQEVRIDQNVLGVRLRMTGSGHHSPDSMYALIYPETVARLQHSRRAAAVLVTPSNRTQATASPRAVSSNILRRDRPRRCPSVR